MECVIQGVLVIDADVLFSDVIDQSSPGTSLIEEPVKSKKYLNRLHANIPARRLRWKLQRLEHDEDHPVRQNGLPRRPLRTWRQ